MLTRRTLFVLVVLVAFTSADALAQTSRPGRPRRPPRPSNEPTVLLLQIEQVRRAAADARLSERRADLEAGLASAGEVSARRRLERQLAQLDKQLDERRGYVLEGWSQTARSDGTPLGSKRIKRGVFLPANARTHRELQGLQSGDRVAIDARTMRDLFTVDGRRFTQAREVRKLDTRRGGRKNRQAIPDPPSHARPGGAPGVDVTFAPPVRQARAHGEKHTRYQGALQIFADAPPEGSGQVFQMWANVSIALANGQTYGPIPYYVDARRNSDGAFTFEADWEVIQLKGAPAIDPNRITFKVLATQWGDREVR